MFKICQLDEFDRWIENLMKYSKMAVVGIMIIESLILVASWGSSNQNKNLIYLLEELLFPTIRNIVIVGLGSVGVKLCQQKKTEAAAYIGMSSVSLMICNIVYTHSEIIVLMGAMGVPIILAVAKGEKKFIDYISLINVTLLLFVQIKVVETSQLSTTLSIATIISSSTMLGVFYMIARGLLGYYGEVLKCWNMVSELSKIDALTGVWCKKAICNELDEMIEEGNGGEMSIALINIDDMSIAAEKYGEEKKDLIINEIGILIKKFANNSIKIGRYGENEFLVIFEKHGVMQVITVCELIRDYIYAQKVTGLKQGEITVSVGIATFGNKTKDSLDLIVKGKEALKKSKESGKNKTVIS